MSVYDLPPAEPPPQLQAAAQRGRRAWQRLGLRLRSVTPSMLARFVLVVGALVLIGRIIWAGWDVLRPFQVGAVLAYLLLPLVNRLERRMPRGVAILLVFGAGLVVLVLALAYLLPIVAEQIRAALGLVPTGEEVTRLSDRINALLATLPSDAQTFVRNAIARVVTNVRENLFTYAQSVLSGVVAALLGFVNTVGFVLGFVVVPFWLFYVLKDEQRGRQAFERLLPRWMRADVLAVLHIIDRVFSNYVRGQVILCLMVGVCSFLGLNALSLLGVEGIRSTVLLGMFAAVTELIPTIGPILGAIPAVIMGLFTSWEATIAIVLLYVLIQQIENAVLVPRVTGKSLDIHPAILMIVLVALSQFGILWAILAAPLSALARDLFRYVYGRFTDPSGLVDEGSSTAPEADATPTRDANVAGRGVR